MTRAQLALAAFWTEHPICDALMRHLESNSFSVKQLIAFAETLPENVFLAFVEWTEARKAGRTVRSHAPHVRPATEINPDRSNAKILPFRRGARQ